MPLHGCTSLHSHQQWLSVPFTPKPLQHRLSLLFLILAILTGVRWYVKVVFICISLIAKEVEHYLKYLLAIWTSSVENSLSETHIGALDWAPKVQLKSRRREKTRKEVWTVRGWFTHWDSVRVLMGSNQIQLDRDWKNMWSNQNLWMWLTMGADW